MTLLTFFFIISSVVIFITAIDAANKHRFNILHFSIFLFTWVVLFILSIYPSLLNDIWRFFWVARWADVIVYGSIVFLFYFALLLFKKIVENQDDMTFLVREFAIENSNKKEIRWKEVFLVRVYNEEQVLEENIKKILDAWYKNILIVNDGSRDNSKQILEKFGDKIILVSHLKNRWWWAALETGFEYLRKYGKCEYVITFDSDGQHNIKDAERFIHKLDKEKDVDIVFWSRFLKWAKTNVPFFRKIILLWWKIFTNIISWVRFSDSHNWYRAMRLKVLKKIHLTTDNMAYASEFIDIVARKKIKFVEIPADIKYTEYSLHKWQKSSNAINIAVKTIWNKFFR